MNYKTLSKEELAKLQELYSNKEFLTVNEAAIWLALSPGCVRKYLRLGKIYGVKFYQTSVWRIDVRKTRALMSKSSNVKKM